METTTNFASNVLQREKLSFEQTGIGSEQPAYFIAKRIFDFVVALILLILLSPVMLAVAILVKLDSPGPVIFSQRRVSCKISRVGGKLQKQIYTFMFYKFRSMQHNADQNCHRNFIEAYIQNDTSRMHEMQSGPSEAGNQYKLNGDKRITKVGKFLRKTSLDELPQLWNILKGDMSLVGPRPPIPYEVEMYDTWHMKRLCTVPGLTGLWQVVARNSVCFDDMVRLDIEYIDNQSFWLDLKILVNTPIAVLFSKKCS